MRAADALKRPTNVSLEANLVVDAKMLGINVSQACERGLRAEVAAARTTAWISENKAAIEASNAYVEAHGLPLATLRQF